MLSSVPRGWQHLPLSIISVSELHRPLRMAPNISTNSLSACPAVTVTSDSLLDKAHFNMPFSETMPSFKQWIQSQIIITGRRSHHASVDAAMLAHLSVDFGEEDAGIDACAPAICLKGKAPRCIRTPPLSVRYPHPHPSW